MNTIMAFCLLLLLGSAALDVAATACLGSRCGNSTRNCSRGRITHTDMCSNPCNNNSCSRKPCGSCHGECAEDHCDDHDEEETE